MSTPKYVDFETAGALRRIEDEQSPSLMGDLGDFFDRRQAAHDIRDMREDDVIDTVAA